MITIVDYGLGNLGSLLNMFKKIGTPARISRTLQEIEQSEKLLLPGVGAFDHAMHQIESRGMIEVLDYLALEKKIPVLGICLGMQLLTESSEEGKKKGLGWISAQTKRLPQLEGIKIPHMGWNVVHPMSKSPLTSGFDQAEFRFYFVHSYFVELNDAQQSILQAHHGIDFCAALQKDNVFGAQFHPEKSHKFGMRLLQNFAKI